MKFFKKYFSEKRKIRVILIHGFSVRGSSEMDPLFTFLQNEGYDVVAPSLFDWKNEKDNDWLVWVGRARKEFEKAKSEGKEIYVVGYSMGGVVATYLSTIFSVKKLVLLAPAFEYRTLATAKRTLGSFLSNDKNIDSMPLALHFPFMSLVDELGNSIEVLKAPVLMLQGSEDQTIPQVVGKRAYKKIPHEHKNLIIIEDGTHRLLDEKKSFDITSNVVKMYFDNLL